MAGHPGVIATMWSVMDHHAQQVVREAYGHLFKKNVPSYPTEAAHALHQAVQKLRESSAENRNASFPSWVPFMHMGI